MPGILAVNHFTVLLRTLGDSGIARGSQYSKDGGIKEGQRRSYPGLLGWGPMWETTLLLPATQLFSGRWNQQRKRTQARVAAGTRPKAAGVRSARPGRPVSSGVETPCGQNENYTLVH